jgi:5-oxopent-3-ene-1,2,5-tricarboxylate decarboxylase / 2-hydroxyhepta-2,4-diene-1,7-dioate isomerase
MTGTPRTIYGVLMNHESEWQSLGDAVNADPYKKAPKEPVLYIKTANTVSRSGDGVPLVDGVQAVQAWAGIALRMKRTLAQHKPGVAPSVISLADLQDLADVQLICDWTAHTQQPNPYYRPAVRSKCADGWCGLGEIAPITRLPDEMVVNVRVNGQDVQQVNLGELRRNTLQLLHDITAFMSLQAGDVLMLGSAADRPVLQAGDALELHCEGLPVLRQSVTAARPAACIIGDESLAVHELDPLKKLDQPRSIFALGLNYADHAKELAFKAPTEPLVFLKGENALTGHDKPTVRPADATHMHYECELVAIIGKTCKHVPRERAHEVIGGYTVANDYAIRDYLENWYRPNPKVKNRDATTPLGPRVVLARDLPDPMNLALTSRVNGVVTQQGNTKDMIFSIAVLVEYFSRFMTLHPGDLILTGTTDGVVDCPPGSVVETEIEGIGCLVNHIRAES